MFEKLDMHGNDIRIICITDKRLVYINKSNEYDKTEARVKDVSSH